MRKVDITYQIVEDTHEVLYFSPKDTSVNCDIYVRENAKLDLYYLQNQTTKTEVEIYLTAQGSEVNIYGLALGTGTQTISNKLLVKHIAPNCKSYQLFKYLLSDEAIGVFDGKIVVQEGAQKTEAYQNNRNLLDGTACRIHSKPQLEIYSDDVKCSHGMATGQLDEASIFYLRSRGIPEPEAKAMLKTAFTQDILDKISADTKNITL
ncbi:ABC transporter permease protein [Candidatus Symbiothrix dinenymphae]|nr:ABC transporter permease protein [Candidatus Symbiothrix dinenymphae]